MYARESTSEAERVAFFGGECGALVPSRACEEGISAQAHFEDLFRGCHGVVREMKEDDGGIRNGDTEGAGSGWPRVARRAACSCP